MNLLTLILGGGPFVALVGFVVYLLQRPKQVAETGLVTTQSWDTFTRTISTERDKLLARVEKLEEGQRESLLKAEEDRRFRFHAIGYIRLLIAQITAAGKVPVDPPHGLDLDDPSLKLPSD